MSPKEHRERLEDGAWRHHGTESTPHFDHQEGRDYMRPPEHVYGRYSCYDGAQLRLPRAHYAYAMYLSGISCGYAYAAAGREFPANESYWQKYGGRYAEEYRKGFEYAYSMFADPETGWSRAREYAFELYSRYDGASGCLYGPSGCGG